jgi:hypothetical protein
MFDSIKSKIFKFKVVNDYSNFKNNPYRLKDRTKNWNGSVQYNPKKIIYPQNVDEICNIVKTEDQLCVVSSGHHFEKLYTNNSVWVCLEKFKKLEFNEKDSLCTVGAGVKIEDIMLFLSKRGYRIMGTGSIQEQTLVGATSNGTNSPGGIYKLSSHYIVEMKMVDGLGNNRIISSNNEDDEELLEALRMSLGLLGVIYEVTVLCEKTNFTKVSYYRTDVNSFMKNEWKQIKKEKICLEMSIFNNKTMFIEKYEKYDNNDTYNNNNKSSYPSTVYTNSFLPDLVVSLYENNKIVNKLVNFCCRKFPVTFNKVIDTYSEYQSGNVVYKPSIKAWTNITPTYDMSEWYFEINNDELIQEILDDLKNITSKDDFIKNYGFPGVKIRFHPICKNVLLAQSNNCRSISVLLFAFGYSNRENSTKLFSFFENEIIKKYIKKTNVSFHYAKRVVYDKNELMESNNVLKNNWLKFIKIKKELDPNNKFKKKYLEELFGKNFGIPIVQKKLLAN